MKSRIKTGAIRASRGSLWYTGQKDTHDLRQWRRSTRPAEHSATSAVKHLYVVMTSDWQCHWQHDSAVTLDWHCHVSVFCRHRALPPLYATAWHWQLTLCHQRQQPTGTDTHTDTHAHTRNNSIITIVCQSDSKKTGLCFNTKVSPAYLLATTKERTLTHIRCLFATEAEHNTNYTRCLRCDCDGFFNNWFIANFPDSVPVKKIQKPVNIWWRRFGQDYCLLPFWVTAL